MFPRLQKRGPIEALLLGWGWGGDAPFPRLQKRGPIEAEFEAAAKSGEVGFPRLQKRGPIEAYLHHSHFSARNLVSTLTKAWPH